MECEVIGGAELKEIVEASTAAPQIVPGTDTDRRPARPTVADGPDAATGMAEA